MTVYCTPESEQQLLDVVNWAVNEHKRLCVYGTNSKSGFGHAIDRDCDVSMREITGIVQYEPSELVMQARAGTPIEEINDALAENNQFLPFEPPLLGKLYGNNTAGTIGGIFMGNLSGPGRFRAGAARDYILGVRAISGRGEVYKSGGNVIKNVTGYDMSKLLAGSWGTLSLLTDVTFKVLPAPRVSECLCVWGQQTNEAMELFRHFLCSPYDVSGLSYVPKNTIGKLGLEDRFNKKDNMTLIRIEGSEISVKERINNISSSLLSDQAYEHFDQSISSRIWRCIRDVSPFQDMTNAKAVLKISIPPASSLSLSRFIDQLDGCEWFVDAAGSWIWVAVCHGATEDKINTIRHEVSVTGGSAVLFRANKIVKQESGIFSPGMTALAELNKRIKNNFDPLNILNPGRLYS